MRPEITYCRTKVGWGEARYLCEEVAFQRGRGEGWGAVHTDIVFAALVEAHLFSTFCELNAVPYL